MILIVIYLGSKMPRYVVRNLGYLQSTFSDYEIFFISDSKKSIRIATETGVSTWLTPNPDEVWKESRELLSHSQDFREGFWFKTLARIFVLESFMKNHPNISCLQIEADVFLFPNFPFVEVSQLNADISFPMESNEMGIASLLYLRDHNAASVLASWAMQAIRLDGRTTDMTFLGQVAHSEKLNFSPLRTLPIQMQNALNQHKAGALVCQNKLNASGVFDGITLGQYLLGIDPRNSRGMRILHRKQDSHAINPEKLAFALDKEGNLILKGEREDTLVYNLHNHAKDLRIYTASSRRKLLQSRVTSSRRGEKKEFLLAVFIVAVSKAIERRVRLGANRLKT